MELELVCGLKSIRLPYSYMENMKKQWIEAYIKWSHQQNELLPTEEIDSCIKKTGEIDYEMFRFIYNECGVFNGLKRFVDHKNSWSKYDSAFIMTTLLQLSSYLQVISPRDFDMNEKYFLYSILSVSIRHRLGIQINKNEI